MMYPQINPEIKIRETISNPLDNAEVIGFRGRNKRMGRPAVVLKDSSLNRVGFTNTLTLPSGTADLIEEDDGEIILLEENRALAIDAETFNLKALSTTAMDGGQAVEVRKLNLTSDALREFPRDAVSVGN